MKKIVYISLVAATILGAAEPMVPPSMSTDRGGLKPAIEAYSDGGGVMLFTDKVNGSGNVTDNSAMNELVFKYGENAKANSTTLQNQIKTIEAATSTATEKALADQIPTLTIGTPVVQNSAPSNGGIFKSTPFNLVNKAAVSIRKTGSYWNQTGAGLFDGVVENGTHTTDAAVYWAYNAPTDIDEFEVVFNDTVRIWRSGYTDYPSYRGRLQILRVNNDGSTTDVSDYQLPSFQYTVSGPGTGEYELFTNEMPAGKYLFRAIPGQYRIDIEWFVEKKV